MLDRETADPFVEGLFGGLPRMATSAFETFSEATIARESPSAGQTSLSVPETKSSSAQRKGMPVLLGATPATGETNKPVSSALSSVTGARTSRRSLSDRLTPSLIDAGLVCGITPSLTRKQSGQPIQVFAFNRPDGCDAAKPPSGSSFSKGSES
jgi:hypothetical protein